MIYHAKDGKPPYGYTIIDHAEKNVFKGGEVISLKELLSVKTKSEQKRIGKGSYKETNSNTELSTAQLNYYSTLLMASLYNYPTLLQGLSAQGLVITQRHNVFYLNDLVAGIEVNVKDLLAPEDVRKVAQAYGMSEGLSNDLASIDYSTSFGSIHLVDDQDDAKRKKKRKT